MDIVMDEQDQLYVKQMGAWFREQEALERQIRGTIETSSAILEENKIQLECSISRLALARVEHAEWLDSKK